jgi:hypothetical protein
MMDNQQMMILYWHLFVEDSSDVVTSIFANKGGQYFDYILQQPSRFFLLLFLE